MAFVFWLCVADLYLACLYVSEVHTEVLMLDDLLHVELTPQYLLQQVYHVRCQVNRVCLYALQSTLRVSEDVDGSQQLEHQQAYRIHIEEASSLEHTIRWQDKVLLAP